MYSSENSILKKLISHVGQATLIQLILFTISTYFMSIILNLIVCCLNFGGVLIHIINQLDGSIGSIHVFRNFVVA